MSCSRLMKSEEVLKKKSSFFSCFFPCSELPLVGILICQEEWLVFVLFCLFFISLGTTHQKKFSKLCIMLRNSTSIRNTLLKGLLYFMEVKAKNKDIFTNKGNHASHVDKRVLKRKHRR